MTPVMNDQSQIKALFDTQLAYLESGQAAKEGSVAIAAGRAAGLAWDAGLEKSAHAIWSRYIPSVVGMPSFAQFRAGYEAHHNTFSPFQTGKDFPVQGTPFSNAAGSYAYALDAAARGAVALAGGAPEWTGYWGAQALSAAGLFAQAAALRDTVVAGSLCATVPAKTV